MGARLVIRSIDGRAIEEEVGYPFDQDRLVIGRGRSADIRIPHRTASELHATLRWDTDHYTLTDEASTNGTRVGGARLVPHRAKRLRDGDELELGVYVMSFHTGALVTEPLSAERTAELARALLRQAREPAQAPGQPPRLVVVWGDSSGKHLALDRSPARWLIGRGEECQLQVEDPELAESHLEVIRDLDGVLLRCLPESATMRVGEDERRSLRVKDGEELRIGNTALLFEEPAEQPLQRAAEGDDEALPSGYRAAPPASATPVTSATPAAKVGEAEAVAKDAAQPPKPLGADARGTGGSPRQLGADLVIYALAAAILAISIAALTVLMGSN